MPEYVVLKNQNGSVITPVTDLTAINMTTINGIVVSAGTIGIMPGYIESCCFMELAMPTTAAVVTSASSNN